MDVKAVVANMAPDMYERLKHAAETGKWPDGTPVDQTQRDSAIQLTMAYQAMHMNNDQMLTIGSDGEIIHKSKAELRNQFKKPVTESTCKKSPEDIARFTEL
ncbi:YeaC family protein [Thalassotalea maritima]|uniref:YeaC family protein n=1 Tax=Thalassotalea maritima TaxID=3242416 RepID=UPI0035290977